MTDSRLSMDNDRRYPLYPISENKPASQPYLTHLQSVNPPLKDAQKYNKSSATTPRASNKENINRSTKIQQKVPSEPVNVNSRSHHNEKLLKGKQRNEKNQRDLNKSLANLIRVPGKSPSGDEVFARQAVNVQKEFNSQTNFVNPVYSSVRCTPEQQRRANPLQAPLATEYYGEDSHYFKKGKYQQGRNGVSIAEFKNRFKNGSGQERQDTFPNFNSRQLLTEGDTPVGRDAYMGVSFAAKEVSQYNQYQQSSVSHCVTETNFGPKLNSGTKMLTEASKRVPLDAHEKQESQNFQNFFDGIKYTAGGVGRSTGEKRERKQEGEPLDWGLEKGTISEREFHTQGSSEKKRVTFITEKTMKKYRPEFLKIKRDIEKRKKSLNEIEQIFMAHDENGSFAREMAEINNHEIFTSISSKGKSPYVHQSQPTQPTYSTFQTQPAQFTTEDVSSPSFPSLHTLPSGSKSVYAKESRMIDRTISSENEREKALTKMACCGSNSGCSMF